MQSLFLLRRYIQYYIVFTHNHFVRRLWDWHWLFLLIVKPCFCIYKQLNACKLYIVSTWCVLLMYRSMCILCFKLSFVNMVLWNYVALIAYSVQEHLCVYMYIYNEYVYNMHLPCSSVIVIHIFIEFLILVDLFTYRWLVKK